MHNQNGAGNHSAAEDDELRAQAQQLHDSVARISELVRNRSAELGRPQSLQIQEWWSSQHSPAILEAAASLDELGRLLAEAHTGTVEGADAPEAGTVSKTSSSG